MDREQRIILNKPSEPSEYSYSECCKIESGVHQGSVLGPLQFLLCINNLPFRLPYSLATLFARDSLFWGKCDRSINILPSVKYYLNPICV